MTTTSAAFAESWVSAWNAHNIDAVLSHFADDAVFTSPIAAQILPETGGYLHGKAAIRTYWALGLEKIRDLHFEVLDVYTGIDTVVIHYRNQIGSRVCEVLTFRDGLVVSGHGTYMASNAVAASGGEG